MVAVARALSGNVKLLLLDEPLSSVDLKTKDNVLANLLQFLEKKETTLLMISHDVNDVVKLSAKHYALCGGKLIFQHNKK
jgi:ABC-type nitrate/sulfonate/bicarbonate transport system ATPase subunit